MRTVIAFLLALLIAPATAAAAHSAAPPPPNDKRASATQVGLPASLFGTTVGATDEASDPSSNCGRAHDTVWYRISGTEPGRVVVRIAALGDLDAVVSVYRPVRSRLSQVGCDATDENGRGAGQKREEPALAGRSPEWSRRAHSTLIFFRAASSRLTTVCGRGA